MEVRYRPIVEEADDTERDQLQAIFDAVDELGREGPGDILIFMSGEREIRDTADALNKLDLRHTEVLPLYARLSNSEQNRVFQPHSGRRIVLATNVAETSLTVPGIKYVIDPGTARISRYSYRTKVQRLPIEPVSQASANQRKGRCGRVSGRDLYSSLFRRRFPVAPGIYRPGDSAHQPGVGHPADDRPWAKAISPPSRLSKRRISAISRTAYACWKSWAPSPPMRRQRLKLTPLGRQLSQLPVDPRLARMVLEAQKHGCVREAMIITSALSIQDPRERSMDKQQASDEKHRRFHDKESDFLAFVNLWNYLGEQQKALSSNQFRRQCRVDFLNYLRVREWQGHLHPAAPGGERAWPADQQ